VSSFLDLAKKFAIKVKFNQNCSTAKAFCQYLIATGYEAFVSLFESLKQLTIIGASLIVVFIKDRWPQHTFSANGRER
jgi:hypothetical protein